MDPDHHIRSRRAPIAFWVDSARSKTRCKDSQRLLSFTNKAFRKEEWPLSTVADNSCLVYRYLTYRGCVKLQFYDNQTPLLSHARRRKMTSVFTQLRRCKTSIHRGFHHLWHELVVVLQVATLCDLRKKVCYIFVYWDLCYTRKKLYFIDAGGDSDICFSTKSYSNCFMLLQWHGSASISYNHHNLLKFGWSESQRHACTSKDKQKCQFKSKGRRKKQELNTSVSRCKQPAFVACRIAPATSNAIWHYNYATSA